MKKIGVLTSGGDAPGMNAAIYGLVEEAETQGVEVVGFIDGYEGLIDGKAKALTPANVKPHIGIGGTFLGTARSERFKDSAVQQQVAERINEELDGLVVIGGDGSYQGALKLSELGVHTIAIPATIDNDISRTELTLGFKTAVRNVVETVDIMMQSAASHHHIYGIEVMGRRAGDLAEWTGKALAADGIISKTEDFSVSQVREAIEMSFAAGKSYQLFIIAEGAMSAAEFKRHIENETVYGIHDFVLGHIQRGGNPVAEDRMLGFDFGKEAFNRLSAGDTGLCLAVEAGEVVAQSIEDHRAFEDRRHLS
ncbi:ATP-dependent 6-phosphofructokinase [Suicoccus acidiformans]|uniref:6-phosphofructokinase n=1 Tax=Suicoccus acidiformans TaxID=2036206 RepID=A0A347WIF3_9LACT|nr:ATP-dependent 6-phosphofructokinase [Suicoccus acidiformans]AXY24860.1 ATP-dependent 6-phosphofructokinase [Suicoccus acidiformans]